MNVGQICSKRIVSVHTGAPLSEVVALMRDEHVGAVIVTQSPPERLVAVGIVTDRDILRAQLGRAGDLSSLAVTDVMTRDPLVVSETASISDAIRLLRQRGVRRAPVIGGDGELRGMISTDDLVTRVALDMMSLAEPLTRQASAGFR
jgi:CBS domain-containing protein